LFCRRRQPSSSPPPLGRDLRSPTSVASIAARKKDFSVYEEELDVTSRINKYLSDNAFRDIALGQSYFALLGLPDEAPPICAA
jgi:hypothetical protein